MSTSVDETTPQEDELLDRIQEYLYTMSWPTKRPSLNQDNSRAKVMRHANQEFNAFALGKVRNFCKPGVLWESRHNRRHKDLLRMLQALMRMRDPRFSFNAIQLNRNVETAPHYDSRNKGLSYCLAVGNFRGGGLQFYDSNDNPTTVVRNNRKWVLYDGKNQRHGSAPVTSGVRFAIIFFTTVPTAPAGHAKSQRRCRTRRKKSKRSR